MLSTVTTADTQWQPIETAPKDGTEIILACWGSTSEGELFPFWLEESDWGDNDWRLTHERMEAHRGSFPATHWMLLPVPK